MRLSRPHRRVHFAISADFIIDALIGVLFF